jgi:ABC-type multidrug transport system ATPase subunit
LTPTTFITPYIAYIPQEDAFDPLLKVQENLDFSVAIRCPHLKEEDRRKRVEAKLAELGLADMRKRLAGTPEQKFLSGGERKRLNAGLDMIGISDVYLFDEPTSGLDPAQRVEIRNLIAELAAGERTVVLSTHVLGEIEAICSRVIVINRGRIVAQDDLSALGQPGRTVRIEVARPGDAAGDALRALPHVTSVELAGDRYVVRATEDVREAVASAAAPFGLLEMSGREKLEDIYLKLTAGGAA